MHNFFLHKNILIFRRFFNSANRFQLYNEKLQLIPISNKQAIIIEDSNIQIKDAK